MSNKKISGISLTFLGVLISIAPNFLVGRHCIQSAMKCAYYAKTEFAIGIIIVVLALLLLFVESREIRLGMSISLALIGILSVFLPNVLIGCCNGKCANSACTCSPLTTSVMAILGILVVIISVVNAMFLNKAKK